MTTEVAGEKPVSSTRKMVPESDLLAIKTSEKKLKTELAEIRNKLAEAESELEIKSTDVEDSEEVKKIRAYLLSEDKRVKAERVKLEEELVSFKEKEKENRVQALASQYQVELDAIKDAEDPEKEALRMVNERLTKGEKTPETVLETGQRGIIKKMPKDMTNEEFVQYEKDMTAKSFSESDIVRNRR